MNARYEPVPGMRVICINGNWRMGDQPGEVHPRADDFYTVRSVRICPHNGEPYFTVAEIVNPPCREGNDEAHYAHWAFLPIDEDAVEAMMARLRKVRVPA